MKGNLEEKIIEESFKELFDFIRKASIKRVEFKSIDLNESKVLYSIGGIYTKKQLKRKLDSLYFNGEMKCWKELVVHQLPNVNILKEEYLRFLLGARESSNQKAQKEIKERYFKIDFQVLKKHVDLENKTEIFTSYRNIIDYLNRELPEFTLDNRCFELNINRLIDSKDINSERLRYLECRPLRNTHRILEELARFLIENEVITSSENSLKSLFGFYDTQELLSFTNKPLLGKFLRLVKDDLDLLVNQNIPLDVLAQKVRLASGDLNSPELKNLSTNLWKIGEGFFKNIILDTPARSYPNLKSRIKAVTNPPNSD